MIACKIEPGECPYCNQSTQIAHIDTPNLEIYQCGSCQKVWMIFRTKRERMIRFKESGPDTNDENLLCPICWRVLEANYQSWHMECQDPTCGYSLRLSDLSMPQKEIKKRYLDLRSVIFEHASKHTTPPSEVMEEYHELKAEYNKIKKYDFHPVR